MVKAISAMKKDEIRSELEMYNVEYSSRDTVPELQMMLKAARADRDVKLSSQIKKEETAKDGTKGLSSMNKAELLKKCEDMGLSVTVHTTMNQMIAMIISALRGQEVPKHTDLLDIGKFKLLTYQEAMAQQPGYCRWVKDTCEEEGAKPHPLLHKFYRYLMNPPAPAEMTKVKSEVKSEPKDPNDPPTPRTIERVYRHLATYAAEEPKSGASGSRGNEMSDGGPIKRPPPPKEFDPELYPSMDLGQGIRTPIPKLQSFGQFQPEAFRRGTAPQ
jgi:hypothetical protein